MSMSSQGVNGGPNNAVILDNATRDIYSRQILFNAQPVTQFHAIADVKTELEAQAGTKVKFLRYADLTGDPTLVEGTDMVTDNMSTSMIEIEVGERGKAVQITEKLTVTSYDNVMRSAAKLLGEHYGRSLDGEIRNCLRTVPTLLRANDKATRAAMDANDKFSVELVRTGVKTLAENKAPKWENDHYLCYLTPGQAADVRRDPNWVEVVKYGAPGRVYNGEIGRIESVRFIETTYTTTVKSDAHAVDGQVHADFVPAIPTVPDEADFHATLDINQAFLVAPFCVGHATALPAEMRGDGVKDFERRHSLAWYAIYGCGLIEDGHAVILESV